MTSIIWYLVFSLGFSLLSSVIIRVSDEFLGIEVSGSDLAKALHTAIRMAMGALLIALVIKWFV